MSDGVFPGKNGLDGALSVFIHSTGTGPSLWAGVPPEVLAGSEKLTPSNLGYPPHPALPRGQRCDRHDEARHLLSQIPDDGRGVHLFAHSYGGLVALEVGEALGGRLRSLFLFEPVMFGALARDTPGDASPEAQAEIRGFTEGSPWFLSDDQRGGTDPWLELFIDYWNRPGSWSRMPPPMRDFSLSMGWKMYQEVRSVFHDTDSFTWPVLSRVPATLALGERTTAGSRAMTTALAARNPGARLVTVAGTGHMAPLTHPAKVHDAMAAHARWVSEGLKPCAR